ncbi:phosphatase PAP2 family protein [uncultured Ruegeria sp.]|uniref:phosphatase PAP2 family protein n=1 Tax=uncultured Ruegeria sp. TaxID=259304 RepID=UPI002637DA5E|nr:phosphatase PAP2 family protein [uncultured Ruegeria sp.]
MSSVEISNRAPQLDGILQSAMRNRLFLCILALHVVGGSIVSYHLGIPFWTELGYSLATILSKLIKYTFVIGSGFLVLRFIYAAIWVKPAKPIHWIINDTKEFISEYVKVTDGIVCFLSIGFLMTSFTCLKNMIPQINPFSWDIFFSQLDQTLHGGYDVWRLLWPVLGNPYITTIINVAYHLWFVLIYITMFVASFDKRNPQRGMVYLVAFALVFILGGNILATIFSSVGPVYFEHFGFGDTYVQQMQNLRELNQISPVWALAVHENLLMAFQDGGIVKGISAMPSMHVASSVIMALFAFRYSRWLGWAFTIFAFLILVGSVHLAWHYAVDGYLAILVALFCWWLANALTKRFYTAPETTSQQI